MKLASLKQGRDGKLVVVSRDLDRAVEVTDIAPTLQAALDAWADKAPALARVYSALCAGELEGFPFDQSACASPLPRAYQWCDGSAYVNHVELVRQARGAQMPASFWTDPLMYQGGSDTFLGPREPMRLADPEWGIDFEGELAVITDDVPMGIGAAAAREHIKLYMLVNDVSLRKLIPAELAKGFGFFQGKPSSAFSPVAVTPDELGEALVDDKVCLPLEVRFNGAPFGAARADRDLTFTFPELIAHAAKTRALGTGTIVGSGTVSNKLDGGPGKPIAEGGVGYSCIAELRCVETIDAGEPATAFMAFGDRVEMEMSGSDGQSIFGLIDQRVEPYTGL